MRRIAILAAACLIGAGCDSGPTEQEQNLSQRGSAPEQMAGNGTGNIASGTQPPAEQAEMGDTMPEEPGGPRGDRASGTGGDSVPTQ